MLSVLLVVTACPGGSALRLDEKQRERVTGDDDPIIVPRSVAPVFEPRFVDATSLDPETTGSIGTRATKPKRSCDTLAWYPERPPDRQFREAC
jgi:hypothetical protein